MIELSPYFIGIFAFLFGTNIGSFFTMLTYRVKNKLGGIVNGRSFCPSCKKQLTILNLVPIFSYLFQRGKCSNCGSKIGIKYFLIELFSGLLFSIFYTTIYFSKLDLSYISIILYSIIFFYIYFISIYDILYKEIEDTFIAPLLILIIGILSYQDITNINLISFQQLIENKDVLLSIGGGLSIIGLLYGSLFSDKHYLYILIASIFGYFLYGTNGYLAIGSLSALYFFLFFYLQFILTGGKGIGGGDFRFSILLGLLYGTIILGGVFTSYIVGGFVSVIVILILRRSHGIELPFAPILFGAYYLLLLLYLSQNIDFLINFTNKLI